jgi:hypothetical protein
MIYNVEDYLHGKRLSSYAAIGSIISSHALADFFMEVCPYEVQFNTSRTNWMFVSRMQVWCESNCTGYWTDSIILTKGKFIANSIWRFQNDTDAVMFKLQLP